MGLKVLDHSLARQVVTGLRDKETAPDRFRDLCRIVSTILIVEATRALPTKTTPVETPLETADGFRVGVGIVAVPILRAGLGMLESVLAIVPRADVGYLGMERDEETAKARIYYKKLPDIRDKHVLLLDPMLATGGSASQAARLLYDAGASEVTMLCIVAAPEGVAMLQNAHPQIHIIAAALDRELNSKKYILPGLGDFGDRLYGTG